MTTKTRWIGTEGAAFERVSLAFKAVGYQPPIPEADTDGAYAANIANQYYPELSQPKALAIIKWGLTSTRDYLKAMHGMYSATEIYHLYGDDQ